MMPHSFNNRADTPLPLVIANTGMGIDHEEYAITAAMAEERARCGDEAAIRSGNGVRWGASSSFVA
jgi:hypothetical protein